MVDTLDTLLESQPDLRAHHRAAHLSPSPPPPPLPSAVGMQGSGGSRQLCIACRTRPESGLVLPENTRPGEFLSRSSAISGCSYSE